jgi:hypothetical protein
VTKVPTYAASSYRSIAGAHENFGALTPPQQHVVAGGDLTSKRTEVSGASSGAFSSERIRSVFVGESSEPVAAPSSEQW